MTIVANPHNAEVPIQLKNGDHIIKYDNNSLATFEQLIGRALNFDENDISRQMGYDFLRKALYIGLKSRYKKFKNIVDVADQMFSSDEWLAYYLLSFFKAVKLSKEGDTQQSPPGLADLQKEIIGEDEDEEETEENGDPTSESTGENS